MWKQAEVRKKYSRWMEDIPFFIQLFKYLVNSQNQDFDIVVSF